jgi:hypothetical protein
MAAPSAVFTIARVAEMLGETEELLDELADSLEPEDGCLWIYDTDDRVTLGFTLRGIESLKELIADQKRRPSARHRRSAPAALAGWIQSNSRSR